MKCQPIFFVCCFVIILPFTRTQNPNANAALRFRLPNVLFGAPFSFSNFFQTQPRPTGPRESTASLPRRPLDKAPPIAPPLPDNANRPLALPLGTNLGRQSTPSSAPYFVQSQPTGERTIRAPNVNNNNLYPFRQQQFLESQRPQAFQQHQQQPSFPNSQLPFSPTQPISLPPSSKQGPPSTNNVNLNPSFNSPIVQSGFFPTAQVSAPLENNPAPRHQSNLNFRPPQAQLNGFSGQRIPTRDPHNAAFYGSNAVIQNGQTGTKLTGAPDVTTAPVIKNLFVTLDQTKKLALDCGGSNDLGYCAMTEKYPKSVVQELAERCRDKIRQMYVEVPEDFESLGEGGTTVVYTNFSRFSKDVKPWSWASYTKESACDSELRYIRPALAQDRNGHWMVVIQTDEFTQRVAIDVCRNPDGVCKVYTDCGRKSRCVQRYSFHTMIAMDQDNPLECPVMKVFKFPTSCNCHVETKKFA